MESQGTKGHLLDGHIWGCYTVRTEGQQRRWRRSEEKTQENSVSQMLRGDSNTDTLGSVKTGRQHVIITASVVSAVSV